MPSSENVQSGIPLAEVATTFQVSVASVRNWLKTGYLIQAGRGLVTKESFAEFKQKLAAGEKLTSRANKSHKDSHDHDELLKELRSFLDDNEIDGYDLGLQYETALANSYRNKEGVYYTPPDIVDSFFNYLPKNCSGLSFCDPCCGSGNFIITALKHGFAPENIYGYDIDPFAVELTKKRIFDYSDYHTKNIQCSDFLAVSLQQKKRFFDVIFTNPPWGKKIRTELKGMYADAVGAGKSVDTSSLFFFFCLEQLNDNGYLGFLLQDAFFNVASYEDARKQALLFQVLAIMDFGKPFKGLLSKAKGIVLKKSMPAEQNRVSCSCSTMHHDRLQRSFSCNPKTIFNSRISQKESDTVAHLYSLPHTRLKGHAGWGLGIVTGGNKRFISPHPGEGTMPVYRGKDITRDGLKESRCYIPSDVSLYQQVAPLQMYLAEEKLIYKFISAELVFFYDQKQRFLLNSANMLIPDDDFPIPMAQLGQILNSRVLNWLFKAVFDTHKVLRSDLEVLPIHTDYFDEHPVFEEQLFQRYLGVEEVAGGAFQVVKRYT